MSEHVLCMVLYLIELGLDNQVQDDTVEEVSFLLNKRGLVSESYSTATHTDACCQYLICKGAGTQRALRPQVPEHAKNTYLELYLQICGAYRPHFQIICMKWLLWQYLQIIFDYWH